MAGWLPLFAALGFNNGKVQAQDYFMLQSGTYPFINMMKTMQSWTYTSGGSAGFPIVATEMDTDGYLTTTATGGCSNVCFVPPSKTGVGTTWVMTWSGRGTVFVAGASVSTGSFSNLGGAATGRCEFTIPTSVDGQITIGVSAVQTNGSDYPRDMKLFLASEETSLNAGNIVSTQYKTIFGNSIGVYRFLDFQLGNAGLTTTWASRKPTTFYSYYADEYRAVDKDTGRVGMAMYGTTTGSGGTYALTVGTGGPADKRILTVKFNHTSPGASTLNLNSTGAIGIVDAAFMSRAPNSNPPTQDLTATLVYDSDLNKWIKFGGYPSNSNGMKNGIPPEIAVQMCIELRCHPYFIVPYLAVDPQTDWLSSLDTYIKANAPNWMIPRYEGPNESWNSFSGFYAYDYISLKNAAQWNTTNDGNNYWYGRAISEIGQTVSTSRANDRTKYQVLCGVQSATYASSSASNPRLNSPRGRGYLAATFSNGSANVSVPGNAYALNAPVAIIALSSSDNYPTGTGITSAPQQTFYVKTTGSTITLSLTPGGSAITFGTTNQTVFNLTPALSPAYNWVTHVCCTGYSNPSAQNTLGEMQSGYDYLLSGSSAIIDTYAATSTITSGDLNTSYAAWYSWANSFGVSMKLCQYEGGWSPDYIQFVVNWANEITSVTKTTAGNFNTVITLGDTDLNGSTRTGHAFKVGMPLCGLGITTMTQLNTVATNVTFTAGSPGTVNYGSAHGFAANQPVTFGAGAFRIDSTFDCPTEIVPGTVLYVKDAAPAGDNTKFTVSLTAGGAALTLSNVTLSSSCSVSKCWVVTAIGANTVTINCDSSSFTNFSVSGSQRTTYGCYGGSNGGTGTAAMINIIRSKSKEAASLRTQTLANYNGFVAAGGEFPSVYIVGGARQVWAVWDPDMYRSTVPPQWLGLRDFSPQ